MKGNSTIIIATLGTRFNELKRAIASLTQQSSGDAIPLVVVNGDRFDRQVVDYLRQCRDIRFHQIATPGVSIARHEARKQVDTPFFGFLDDDDEYLPEALTLKYREFEARPDVDVVVGNGWRDANGQSSRVWEEKDTATIAANPADALMSLNWLASCGPLFRTDAVGPEILDFDFRYFELSYLAIRLALTRKISFVAEPTFVIHDTPNSASNSEGYLRAYPTMLSEVMKLEMPPSIRKKLKRRLLAAHHDLSEYYRDRGAISTAWKHHLRSMAGGDGLLQYGLFTRRLLVVPPARTRAI